MRGIDDAGRLRAHYQPIVDARTRATVAYEALARDETGVFPAARFAAARVNGRLAELDAECLRAALTGAAGLDATLFVNVEPESFDGPPAIDVAPARVMVELTERGLTTRPAELLLAVERVRRLGWGIAIDDVGVDWRSIALMPFLRPDVIKLDRGLLRDADSRQTAQVVNGVRAHIDAHGGLLLAEGIEEEPDADCARALGATLGQGWLYGRPAPLAAPTGHDARPLVSRHAPISRATPFETLRALRDTSGVGTKAELLVRSMHLERAAGAMADPAVVLATFQHAERFTARVRERYSRLARGAAFVGAFGVGLAPEPAPGVRGADLDEGEALRDEWCVIVVGPQSAIALIARDLGDTGPDMERRFEFALTDDREVVMPAARALLLRVAAQPPPRAEIRADLATPEPAAPGPPGRRRDARPSRASGSARA